MSVYSGMRRLDLLEDNIAIGGYRQTNLLDISQINY
jgi:hypothetical protein